MNIVATFTSEEITRIADRLSVLHVKREQLVSLGTKEPLTLLFVQGNSNKSSTLVVTDMDPYAYKTSFTLDFDKVITIRRRTARIDAFVALAALFVKTWLRNEKLYTPWVSDGCLNEYKPWKIGDEVFRAFGETDIRTGKFAAQSLKRCWKQIKLDHMYNDEMEQVTYRQLDKDEITAYFNSLPEAAEINIKCENTFGGRMAYLQHKIGEFQEDLRQQFIRHAMDDLAKNIGAALVERSELTKAFNDLCKFPSGGIMSQTPAGRTYDRGEPVGVITKITQRTDGSLYFDVEAMSLGNGFFEKIDMNLNKDLADGCNEQSDNTCNTENTFESKRDHDYRRAKAVWKEIRKSFKTGEPIPAELSEELRDFLYGYQS